MFEVHLSNFKYFLKQKARKKLSKNINDGLPRYSLVRLIIGLTTFIVSISAFIGFNFIHEFTLNNLKQTAFLIVKNGVNEIDEWLSVRSSEIETIAATDIVRLLNWSMSAPYLKSEVERIREFDWLAVGTPDGWRHSTATGNERKNIKDRDYFKKAMAGQTLEELKYAQSQMIQNEKMSSLGQMVAGIAHEINNPVNFIHGNLNHLNNYTQDLSSIIRAYQQYFPTPPKQIQELIDEIDISFIQEDLSKVINSMSIGTKRIREIVLSLRNFSRLDEAEVKEADIHEGIDSTLINTARLRINCNDFGNVETRSRSVPQVNFTSLQDLWFIEIS